MKLLIFGSGFIANNFIRYWQNKYIDSQIIVLYNNHKVDNNKVIQYCINNTNIQELLCSFLPQYIVCFQGNSFVSDNNKIQTSLENNVIKISNFLENILCSNIDCIKKIIIVGSAGEYGKLYDNAVKENTMLNPNSLYGLSKTILYEISKYYARLKLPIVYIRQFNTIGIGQQDKFVVPSFTKQIVEIEKGIKNKICVGDLSQERDFIDIYDTCVAYDLILQKGCIGDVYNVASGEYISIKYLLETIIKYSNLEYNNIDIEINHNKFQHTSLSKRLFADISKLSQLNFKCTRKIDDTIQDMLNYWRKNV